MARLRVWTDRRTVGHSPRIQDLTKDLNMQLSEFKRFNRALADVAARGAPPELVMQLREAGPDALENIETLARSAPGQFGKFVGVWKQSQAQIEAATKIDFDKQLAQWFGYGKNIAKQIIFGLRSENVALDNAFRKYITERFPDYVAEAVAKARREANEGTTATTPPRRMTTGKPTNNTVVHAPTEIKVQGGPGENSG